MKKSILVALMLASTLCQAGTCFEKWSRLRISTNNFLNQNALKDKLNYPETEQRCTQDLKRIGIHLRETDVRIDPKKMAACVVSKINSYDIGVRPSFDEAYLPQGCLVPTIILDDAHLASKFLECRNGDFQRSSAYLPNRQLKCGANYCFLMKVNQMLDFNLNNCRECGELRSFIEAAPILSLKLHDVYLKALELTNFNITHALLVSYWTLGHDWKRPEPIRNLDYFQASLQSVSPKRFEQQDNFGPWYHFFGTAFFAISHNSVNKSKLGSIVAELLGDLYNWRAIDPNELKRDLDGSNFLGELLNALKNPPQSVDCDGAHQVL